MKSLVVFLNLFWVLGISTASAQCSSKEHIAYTAYDSYLSANPNVPDDVARQRFSSQLGVTPKALKDMYFRCLYSTLSSPPEPTSESSKTSGLGCNTLGYRYGHTASTSLKGRKPKIEWDFIMPERCRGLTETNVGIKKGSDEVLK